MFYHDTHGQIYESAAKRNSNKFLWKETRERDPWKVYKIYNAIMAVNISTVAILVHLHGKYNTTALFYHSPQEEESGRIYRVFTRYPDDCKKVTRTPYLHETRPEESCWAH